MGNVFVTLSMSLDGFIAGPGDDVGRVFEWYFNGDTDYEMPSGRRVLKIPSASAELVRELFESPGAVVAGRRLFDVVKGWDGNHPADVPVFVVTHNVPPEWANKESPFTFVTDGVENAIEKAKEAAENKKVCIGGGANITQQCIKAGLVDEIQIDLIPVLLGEGIRLFEHLGTESVELERTKVMGAPGVTHLRYLVKTNTLNF